MGRLTTAHSFGVAWFADERAVDVNVVKVDKAWPDIRALIKNNRNAIDGRARREGRESLRRIIGINSHGVPARSWRAGDCPIRAAPHKMETVAGINVESRRTSSAVTVSAVVKAEFGERDPFNSINGSTRGCI